MTRLATKSKVPPHMRSALVLLMTLVLLAVVLPPRAAVGASLAQTWAVGYQPFGVAVDPTDGHVYVANNGGTTVSVIDPAQPAAIAAITTGNAPAVLAIDPAGRRLYVTNYTDASLAVVDLTTLAVLTTVSAGGLGVAVDPTAHRAYTTGGSYLAVVDTTTNTIAARVSASPGDFWLAIALDPTTHRIYVENGKESASTLVVLSDVDYSKIAEVPLPLPARLALAVDPARQLVFVGSYVPASSSSPGSLYVVDASTLQITRTTTVGVFPSGIALAPSRHRVYVTNLTSASISELDDVTFGVTKTIALPWEPGPGAMHPDGRLYVAANLALYQPADRLGAILLDNSAPVVDGVGVTPTSPRTGDLLSATASAHDVDGDAITFTYQWSRNGAPITGATGSSLDLAVAGNGDRGDTIAVAVTASDGQVGSTASASVVVADSAPSLSVSLDMSAPATNAVATARAVGADADGDVLTYSFAWKVNGLVRRTTSGPNTSDTFDLGVAGNGDHGDTLVVEVTASDGTLVSGAASASATIVNSAPTVGVSLNTTKPTTRTVLVATAAGQDLDRDPLTFTYTWRLNGVVRRTTTTSATTDSYDLSVKGNGSNEDVITVSVIASDGTLASGPASASATVMPGKS